MSVNLNGVGVALVTPFTLDGEVDFSCLKKVIQHISEGGVDYIVVNGTTAESPTTNSAETQQILDFVVAENYKKLPIVFGIGSNSTGQLLHQLKGFNFSNVDAILSVAPYYNKPTQKGLHAHFTAVADIAEKPVILYNVPGRTSSNISAETTLSLAKHPNIIGIKEASDDLNQIQKIAKDLPEDFFLISGDDMKTFQFLTLGGHGVISVLANALPVEMAAITTQGFKGNWEASRKAQLEILPINDLMYIEGNPAGLKFLMHQMGLIENTLRLPLVPVSKELSEKIEAEFLNVLEKKSQS